MAPDPACYTVIKSNLDIIILAASLRSLNLNFTNIVANKTSNYYVSTAVPGMWSDCMGIHGAASPQPEPYRAPTKTAARIS